MQFENQNITIQQFVDRYINIVKKDVPTSSGNLKNSLTGVVTDKGENGYEFEILGLEYGAYINAGVNGTEVNWGSEFTFDKMLPVSAFEGIANQLDISPWAIAKSIQKKGLKPTNFLTEHLDAELDIFATDLAEAMWEDFYDENKEDTIKTIK